MRGTWRTLRYLATGTMIATAATTACSTDSPLEPMKQLTATARDAAANRGVDKGKQAKQQKQLLATIRRATARYHSIDAALADGYVQGSPCESMPGQGIGIHYRKASLFDAVVDPSQPEILVYEPKKNGKLDLIAVAFVVPAAAWDDGSHTSPPLLGNQVFEDKRVPDWSSPPFPTYVLHVWVWKTTIRMGCTRRPIRE